MDYFLWMCNSCKERILISHYLGNTLFSAYWICMQNSLSQTIISLKSLKYEEILVYSGYKRNINDLFDTSLLCSELLVAGKI